MGGGGGGGGGGWGGGWGVTYDAVSDENFVKMAFPPQ